MSQKDRGDRPKKSWRELDSMRDRAAGPRPPRGEREPPRSDNNMDARTSKQYRAALDALFEKGEVGKLAEKLSGPGASRIDPLDVVRGTHRGGATPTTSGAGSSSSSSSSSSSPAREPPLNKAPPAPPAPPPKEDGRAALRKKLIESLGRDEISRNVDRYVKAHGWPNDFELLEQALEHTKPERQTEAMDQLAKLLEREKPKRSRSLAGKLRFIEETSDSTELREQAARIRAKL